VPAPPGGASFVLQGKPFCFLGTNNYYVSYKPRAMTDELLESARAMGLRVLRVWANIDRGSLDGAVSSVDPPGAKDGVYYQYWDNTARRPRYNDGRDGLERLDYVLHKARQLDLKVILVLTNNWPEFGGMDQYLAWYGLTQHRAFYEDGRVVAAYKDWLSHLVFRRNAFDGVVYRDDPVIFAWELANEPRCMVRPTGLGGQTACAPDTLLQWASRMASYVHEIDPHHLVSVGDEGFFSGGEGFGYDGAEGVDHAALARLPQVDFATYHLYPDAWHRDAPWSRRWIEDHVDLARTLQKPTLLEEYGVVASGSDGDRERASAYALWHELVVKRGGNGALFWMLAGHDERGARYPDYDHFAVYPDDATATLFARWAPRFADESVACQSPARAPGAPGSPYVTVAR